jgi:hypothetical protein
MCSIEFWGYLRGTGLDLQYLGAWLLGPHFLDKLSTMIIQVSNIKSKLAMVFLQWFIHYFIIGRTLMRSFNLFGNFFAAWRYGLSRKLKT